ncbi:PEGA domain-containing protein [bacterium]|nr:PEGA domain-containing protein [bacterium]
MIKRLVQIILIMAVFPEMSSAQTGGEKGVVILTSSFPVEGVVIDDSLHNHGLPYRVELAPGLHSIIVKNPRRFDYLQADFFRMVEVRANEEIKLTIEFPSLTLVNSYPHDASIVAGGIMLGKTPMPLELSRYKNQSLALQKSGYDDFNFLVTDSAIQKSSIWITLDPKDPYASNHHDNEFKTEAWKERGIGKNKNWLIITSVLGITSGGIAAYYKNKADNAFEKAKRARRTGDRDLQAKLENRTEKYDRYSTIGFIGLQINLGAAVYFLLKAK